ncbi:MAG: 5-methyltetrahydropteroyltriglutamate--homocysteine S-methyltransferase [Bacteroidales bacterium]|nr:5-methyltetrahydropteroyltriglutamate--homocysteine S-methyltransferase [Bacteroidales bacterium]
MKTQSLGYPRIGSQRELKKACEQYWSGKISGEELVQTGMSIRQYNWQLQKDAGIDLIPSNDFSFYDHILDMSLTVGAIPQRYTKIVPNGHGPLLDLYFAMARGYQKNGLDITAMEMTKWFDTNYHYIVPEYTKNQSFNYFSSKIVDEFLEAKNAGINTKPVIIGPVTYLLSGKEKEPGFNRLDLIENLLPVYLRLLKILEEHGAEWVQFDEPFLVLDITKKAKSAFQFVYNEIYKAFPKLKTILTTYFEGLRDNLELAVSLPVTALHIDLVRCPQQLAETLEVLPAGMSLSIGIIDGRNIWKNDFQQSLELINNAVDKIGAERVLIAPSCSLLHSPCDLDFETMLDTEIKQWLAFAKQKINEVVTLKQLASPEGNKAAMERFIANQVAIESRKTSRLINNQGVKQRIGAITETDAKRQSVFSVRKSKQRKALNLPLLPTTTIGSFPQTIDVRSWRTKLKKGEINSEQYDTLLKGEIEKTLRWQEEIGIDVLVHGEFERNDMVEYFGEKLNGFVFTQNGWVQSYGSRCVKPPIIFGDIYRPNPMTVYWTVYAQSLTQKHVKGMLTGPVTILQWSFVRNDQPRSQTCTQIALAIRDEVMDLEKAGIKIIQIDEPAIREGLPLRKADWQEYLHWAVRAFRIAASGVNDETQIHTHMCYAEFNDIIQDIADMDADVITIECSRSQMELLDAFAGFKYPNEIGPGVYDIHSPRIPSVQEMKLLMKKALELIPKENLWINPDCGLKTRGWAETSAALKNMARVALELRKEIA